MAFGYYDVVTQCLPTSTSVSNVGNSEGMLKYKEWQIYRVKELKHRLPLPSVEWTALARFTLRREERNLNATVCYSHVYALVLCI